MEVLNKGVEANVDGLKKGVEAKINGIEKNTKDNMKDMKNDLKADMEGLKEGLKEGLTNLIQEMIPNGKKIVEETHDEKKINVNRDFINSNVGLKTHHIPKIDMRKFDGKDLVTWIVQMEQCFDLHNVENTKKVCIVTLYLEQNTCVWYR